MLALSRSQPQLRSAAAATNRAWSRVHCIGGHLAPVTAAATVETAVDMKSLAPAVTSGGSGAASAAAAAAAAAARNTAAAQKEQLRVWTRVDEYFSEALHPQVLTDPVLTGALDDTAAAGMTAMNVAPNQGVLLRALAMSAGARRILEVGTLGGYSTVFLARALPSDDATAHVHTLESVPLHARVARAALARSAPAVRDRVTVHVGAALDTLRDTFDATPDAPASVADAKAAAADLTPARAIARARAAPGFEFVFIDADKANNVNYFRCALRLCRAGALIVVDNVVRNGKVADADSSDPSVRGVRALADWLSVNAAPLGLVVTALQTVGSKGYDGLILARVARAGDLVTTDDADS